MFRSFISALILLSAIAAADEITIVGDVWPPYNDVVNAKNPGYGIEIATEVFAKSGHTVKYLVIPWSRALEGTVSGTYTAAIGAFDGDVAGGIIPKEAIGINSNAFFVKKGDVWKYTGLTSLTGKQVGLIKDYTYDKGDFDKWASTATTIQWATGEDPLITNLKKLALGRIDVVIEDRNVVMYTAKQKGLTDQIQEAGSLKGNNSIYIAFSPNNPKSKVKRR